MALQALICTYRLTFLAHAIAIALTVAALAQPNWVVSTTSNAAKSTPVSALTESSTGTRLQVGLAERCFTSSTGTTTCTPFPHCNSTHSTSGDDTFCVAWQTAAFLVWLTTGLQLAAALAYVSPAALSLNRRRPADYSYDSHSDEDAYGNGPYLYLVETAWRVIVYFVGAAAVAQAAGVGLVRALVLGMPAARFWGSALSDPSRVSEVTLGASWWMVAASTLVLGSNAAALGLVGWWNPPAREYVLGEYVCILDDDDESEDGQEDEGRDYYVYIQRARLENLRV